MESNKVIKKLDARGLTCPAPVLLVKDSIDKENPEELSVLVDNDSSSENVTRFLGTRNYTVEVTPKNDEFHLEAKRGKHVEQPEQAVSPAPSNTGDSPQKILVLVTSDRMGRGDDELGEKLMISYLRTINEMEDDLWQLIFVNSGVKLTTTSSPVLKELQGYEKDGVIILACGTCLEHFNLTETKKVGAATNMLDIVTATQLADKVVQVG